MGRECYGKLWQNVPTEYDIKQRSFMVYSDLYCFWITTVRINNVIYTISTCSRKLQTPPYLLENPSDGDVL